MVQNCPRLRTTGLGGGGLSRAMAGAGLHSVGPVDQWLLWRGRKGGMGSKGIPLLEVPPQGNWEGARDFPPAGWPLGGFY